MLSQEPQLGASNVNDLDLAFDSPTPAAAHGRRRPGRSITAENEGFSGGRNTSVVRASAQSARATSSVLIPKDTSTDSDTSSDTESPPSLRTKSQATDASLKTPKAHRTSRVTVTTNQGPSSRVIEKNFEPTGKVSANVPDGPKFGANQGLGRLANAGSSNFQQKRKASGSNVNLVADNPSNLVADNPSNLVGTQQQEQRHDENDRGEHHGKRRKNNRWRNNRQHASGSGGGQGRNSGGNGGCGGAGAGSGAVQQ